MDWKLIFILIAIFIYAIYNILMLCFFGIPESLSMTFYLLKNKKPWTRFFFPIMMISLSLLLLPSWLEISTGHNLQFLTFLAAAGIMFTGVAPEFQRSDLENIVHTGSAIVSASVALIWVVCCTNAWNIVCLWFLFFSLIAFITKTIINSYTYWLEQITVVSTFNAILLYFI